MYLQCGPVNKQDILDQACFPEELSGGLLLLLKVMWHRVSYRRSSSDERIPSRSACAGRQFCSIWTLVPASIEATTCTCLTQCADVQPASRNQRGRPGLDTVDPDASTCPLTRQILCELVHGSCTHTFLQGMPAPQRHNCRLNDVYSNGTHSPMHALFCGAKAARALHASRQASMGLGGALEQH